MGLPRGVKLITNRTAQLPGDWKKQPERPRRKRGRKKSEYAARFAMVPTAPVMTDADRAYQRALFERHDRATVWFRVPLAPSTNHYWRSKVLPGVPTPLVYVSAEGKAYKEAVAALWRTFWQGWPPEPLTGRLRLLLCIHHWRRENIDLDDRIKPLQDALTACGVWSDDSQIDDVRAIRGPKVAEPGAIDVTIETISE